MITGAIRKEARPEMKDQVDLTGAALVVIDPQVDILSTNGAIWKSTPIR